MNKVVDVHNRGLWQSCRSSERRRSRKYKGKITGQTAQDAFFFEALPLMKKVDFGLLADEVGFVCDSEV